MILKATFLSSILLLLFSQGIKAQDQEIDPIDTTIQVLYEVISGPAGEDRDWDRMRNLFAKDAQLIPSGNTPEGTKFRRLSIDDYIKLVGPELVEGGFFENEINRETEVYGSLAHVWSTYESRKKEDDKKPMARGINSIQLFNNGNRWFIMSVYWLSEDKDTPIPDEYAPEYQD